MFKSVVLNAHNCTFMISPGLRCYLDALCGMA